MSADIIIMMIMITAAARIVRNMDALLTKMRMVSAITASAWMRMGTVYVGPTIMIVNILLMRTKMAAVTIVQK